MNRNDYTDFIVAYEAIDAESVIDADDETMRIKKGRRMYGAVEVTVEVKQINTEKKNTLCFDIVYVTGRNNTCLENQNTDMQNIYCVKSSAVNFEDVVFEDAKDLKY